MKPTYVDDIPPTLPHPMGNQLRHGLNTFGCDSIIRTDGLGLIWKFLYFGRSGTANRNNAYYERLSRDGTPSGYHRWFTPEQVASSTRVVLNLPPCGTDML